MVHRFINICKIIKWVEDTLRKLDSTASIHSYINVVGAWKAHTEGSY